VTNASHQDADSLLLAKLATQTPRFATNLTNHFPPMLSQGETPSGVSGTTDVGADPLDNQHSTTNDANLLGDLIPMPSPRGTTQSPETHQLHQILRSHESDQVRSCDSPSNSDNGADFQCRGNSPRTFIGWRMR